MDHPRKTKQGCPPAPTPSVKLKHHRTLRPLTEEGRRQRDIDTFLDCFFKQSETLRRLEGLE